MICDCIYICLRILEFAVFALTCVHAFRISMNGRVWPYSCGTMSCSYACSKRGVAYLEWYRALVKRDIKRNVVVNQVALQKAEHDDLEKAGRFKINVDQMVQLSKVKLPSAPSSSSASCSTVVLAQPLGQGVAIQPLCDTTRRELMHRKLLRAHTV